MNELEIFTAAVELSDPEDRARILDEICGTHGELRKRIEALLRNATHASAFLETPAHGLDRLSTNSSQLAEQIGEQIGPFRLLEKIGEGGMGTVFLAEQVSPVLRRVAIKVIKPGMDTRQVIARFEAERHTLALMDHVNIARVIDAGTADSGRPYFVMELVRGVPITKYCDDNRLTLRQRLELLIPVCHAIHHAHQKGIIHRDIKPSNVMISIYEGRPVPKVIDFGVAKATETLPKERTLVTHFGTLVGTLEYMSPEQAELSPLGVDTRSDIYSLGVLLYELLTGSTPLDAKRTERVGYSEVLRLIREVDPPKPSARLSESGESLATIATQRQVDPDKLTKMVRGELDWLAMKALDKDRSRRYDSAIGLADDLQRFLSNEPVWACPPTRRYRLRKLVSRNRAAFAFGSISVFGLLVGAVALAVSNVMVRQEQMRTSEENLRAERAQGLAETREQEIRHGLERLKSANVWLERGRWLITRGRWDDADVAFSKAIELRQDHISAWRERSEMFAALNLFDLAAADFAQEFLIREPSTTSQWFRYALLRLSIGDEAGYHDVRQRMSQRFQGTTNREFSSELARTSLLIASKEVDYRATAKTIELALAGEPESWYLQYLLGIALYRAGDYEPAAQHLEASLTGAPLWEVRALSNPALAMARFRMGQIDQARQALRDAADAIERWTKQRYQAQDWLQWEIHQGAVPDWPIAWWDWIEFQRYYTEATLLIDGVAPPVDPRHCVLRARSLAGLRRNSKADVEYAAALRIAPNDGNIQVEAHRSAGYTAVGREQWSRAASEFGRASRLSSDDSYLRRFQAVAHLGAGEVREYRQACHDMLEHFENTSDWRAAGNVTLACVLRDDAVADPSRLIPLAQRAAPWPHMGVYVYGASLYRSSKFEEAIACFNDSAKLYRPQALDWSFLAMAHHRLGHAEEARRCFAKAGQWIDDANRQTEDDLSGAQANWGSWSERVMYPLLYQETETLLRNGK